MAGHLHSAAHSADHALSQRCVLSARASSPNVPLLIFDQAITRQSPIGSCLLNMLQPIARDWPVHLFANSSDLPAGPHVLKWTIPLPRGPVFVRALLYTLFAGCAYLFSKRNKVGLRITSEGAFPLCDICYSQYCHKFFLSHHRDSIAGSGLRRIARILTHRWMELTERLAFRSARVIVVPSQGIARELRAAYSGLVQNKIVVIPNPVNLDWYARAESFKAAEILREQEVPHDAFVLSFCALGHFERKGLRLLLEALALLQHPGLYLFIIGGSPGEVREYQRLASQLQVSEAVRFVGLQADVRPFLWSSQVFVFPSAYEGFALACLQAAAAGLALITTRINGVEEFIEDGVNGWIVERTASSVASAISTAASSPDVTSALGRKAQQDVRQYSEENFQARWRKLLEEQSAAIAAAAG